MAKSSVLTHGKKQKGDRAAQDGLLDEARTCFLGVCKTDPTDVEAWVKLSLVEKRLGNFAAAESSASRALRLNPQLSYAHHVYGVALHSQGKLAEAIQAYRKAIAFQANLVDAHYLLGCAWQESGDIPLALGAFKKTLGLNPSHVDAMGNLAGLYIDLGEIGEANVWLDRALSIQPGNPFLLCNRANALRLEGKNEEAMQMVRNARRLAPAAVAPISLLAGMQEKNGQIDEAEQLIRQGLALAPGDPLLRLTMAQLARRMKRNEEAVAILEKLAAETLPAGIEGDVLILLGQIHDQLDRPDVAFPLICRGKQRRQQATVLNPDGGASYRNYLQQLGMCATPELADSLVCANIDESAPVFLIGFPRSGTTLLDQILDAHPAVQVMEERPAVSRMLAALFEPEESLAERLPSISPEEVEALKRIYYAEARNHVELQTGQILVDKLPLNLAAIPIIVRIFPGARFILAIRHPCDTILSCLMQNFAVNDAMACFYTLEDTVDTYVTVMSQWQKFTNTIPVNYHQIRYEDLISDLEASCRGLLSYLGLGWDPSVLNHVEHAKSRPAINTPSYHQVTQPIYSHARNRWRRYEKEFAQQLPKLQPFIDYFGYEE